MHCIAGRTRSLCSVLPAFSVIPRIRYLKNSDLEHSLVKLGGKNEKEEIEQMISGKVWLVRSGRNYVAESLKLEGELLCPIVSISSFYSNLVVLNFMLSLLLCVCSFQPPSTWTRTRVSNRWPRSPSH